MKQNEYLNKKFRSNWEPSIEVGLSFEGDPGVTKQSFKDECDINNILKRYVAQGVNPFQDPSNPDLYHDLTQLGSYNDMMEQVTYAQQAFEQLPAAIRDEFNNDPGRLLDALHDESKHNRLRELKILNEKPAPPVQTSSPSQTPEMIKPAT